MICPRSPSCSGQDHNANLQSSPCVALDNEIYVEVHFTRGGSLSFGNTLKGTGISSMFFDRK